MRIYVSVYTYVAGCTRPIRILHMYACIYVCVLYSRPMQILHIYACIYVCIYMHLYMFMLWDERGLYICYTYMHVHMYTYIFCICLCLRFILPNPAVQHTWPWQRCPRPQPRRSLDATQWTLISQTCATSYMRALTSRCQHSISRPDDRQPYLPRP